ncbi:putative 7-deoxyloganetin glucosyltransferase [Helianthus anomalus]
MKMSFWISFFYVIPAPTQSHINRMLELAKILNSEGLFITFVNTELKHQRLLQSLGSDASAVLSL